MLQDLLELCERHAGLWAVVRRHLRKPDRDAIAASCSRARRQSNLAVTTVHLTSDQDASLDKDLQQVFPHAGVLELVVGHTGDGEGLTGEQAADVLTSWSTAGPGLLGQVTHLTLDCWDMHLMGSATFKAALVALLNRCTKLEHLVLSASSTRCHDRAHDHHDHDYTPNELHLRFTGAPPDAAPGFCLGAWLAGTRLPPTPSSALPHTTPAAARMAAQLAAFAAHPDVADPTNWPRYPCLVEVCAHPTAPQPALLPCSVLCRSLRALELCHLAAAPIPPATLDAFQGLTQLTELRMAGYAVDGTPLTPLLEAIGGLPSLSNLSIFHGAHNDDVTEPFNVPDSWSQLGQLTHLYVTIGQPVQLQQLTALTSLHRLYVQLVVGHLSHLRCLQQLTALKLDSEGGPLLTWADAGSGAVTWGGGLQELDAEGCLDMDAGALAAVGRLTGLQVLRVCLLEASPPMVLRPLGALTLLEELSIMNPPVQPELWRLLSQLPLLRILQLQPPVHNALPDAKAPPAAPQHPSARVTLPALQHLSSCLHQTLAHAMVWCHAPALKSAFAESPPPDHPSGYQFTSMWLQPTLVDANWYQALLNGMHPATRGPSDTHGDAIKPVFVLLTDADALALLHVPAATLVQLGFRLLLGADGRLGVPALQSLVQHVASDTAALAQLTSLQLSVRDDLDRAHGGPEGANGAAFRAVIRGLWWLPAARVEVLELSDCTGLGDGWLFENLLMGPCLRVVSLAAVDAATDGVLRELAGCLEEAAARCREGDAAPAKWAGLDELRIACKLPGGCAGVTLAGVRALAASGKVKHLLVYNDGFGELPEAAGALQGAVRPGCRVTLLQPGRMTAVGFLCGVVVEWLEGAPAANVVMLGAGMEEMQEGPLID